MPNNRQTQLTMAVVFFLAASPLCAFQNEPTGFRQIIWGASYDGFAGELTRGGTQKPEAPTQMYRRSNENLNLGGATLESVFYTFYKGRFYRAFLTSTTAPASRAAFLNAFRTQFGPPSQPNRFIERYFWNGSIAQILVNCESQTDGCNAIIQSTAIFEEQNADDAKKAKEAVKDF